MKKKSIILIGLLMLSFVFMASASALYSRTISQSQCSGVTGNPWDYTADDTEFIFTNVPFATGDGTLTVKIKGDYNGYEYDEHDEYFELVEIFIEGTSFGVLPEGDNEEWQCTCEFITMTFTLTKEQINQWMADGQIVVTLEQGEDVNCLCGTSDDENECKCCDISRCTNTNEVTLEYPGANNSLPMLSFMKIFGLGQTD